MGDNTMKLKKIIALLALLAVCCFALSGCVIKSISIVGADGKTYNASSAPKKGTLMLHTSSTQPIQDYYQFRIAEGSYVNFRPANGASPITVSSEDIYVVDYNFPAEGSEDDFTMTVGVDYELAPGEYTVCFNDELSDFSKVTVEAYYFDEDGDEIVNPDTLASEVEYFTVNVGQSLPTGDGASLMLWAAVTLVGAAGVVMMAKKRREA